MPICHKHRYIFVHIPKSAGTSTTYTLGHKLGFSGTIPKAVKTKYGLSADWWQHVPFSELKQFISDIAFDEYFKFAFVRNPYDKVVSAYSHWKQIGRIKDYDTLAEWVSSKEFSESEFMRPQLDFITNNNGELMVDFVGRFENLQKDWEYIANRLGVNARLANIQKSRHRHYSVYYTEEAKQIVSEKYEKDLKAFNYNFENLNFFQKGVLDTKKGLLLSFYSVNSNEKVGKIKTFVKKRFPQFYLKLRNIKNKITDEVVGYVKNYARKST